MWDEWHKVGYVLIVPIGVSESTAVFLEFYTEMTVPYF